VTDFQISELALKAMEEGKYREAHAYLDKMQNKDYAVKFKALVIEHQISTNKEKQNGN
jgi:cytochrome c-type biogenesis protein CcmH/NrfG